MLLTNEKLQRLFQESLNRQQKKKERQKKKRIEERKRKERENKKKNSSKPQKIVFIQKTGEHSSPFNSRSFNVYNNKYILREIADEDLYTTRHELQEAEKRGEGKINWDIWNKLVHLG